MKRAFVPLLVSVALVIAGCLAFREAESSHELSEEEIAVLLSQPNTVDWEYPIMAKVWYPGDGPLPEHPFTYYTTRCWPGCHDPNSQPRPAKY